MQNEDSIRILNPDYARGRVTHALFDFDGTISLIRRGWEEVMQALMMDMITGTTRDAPPALRREVIDYIDESTGILTIYQMRWLEQAVKRWGLNADVLTAQEYKALYNRRLLEEKVRARLAGSGRGGSQKQLLLQGAGKFIAKLASRGVVLLLASGTDDEYVQEEAALLGMKSFFGDRIYGALEDSEEYSKENIIDRILNREVSRERGEIMAVFGDGPVEIRAAKRYGALAVGVASDEDRGAGWNTRKSQRLEAAGADLLIADFLVGDELLDVISDSRES